MAVGEFLGWLGKVVTGDKIKQQLNRKGLQDQVRVLTRALAESQDHRQEYADALDRVHRIAADRDHYHAEMMKLRLENAELRLELEALRKGSGA